MGHIFSNNLWLVHVFYFNWFSVNSFVVRKYTLYDFNLEIYWLLFTVRHMFSLEETLVCNLKKCELCSVWWLYSINGIFIKLCERYPMEVFISLFYQLLSYFDKFQHGGIWPCLPFALTMFALCNMKLLHAGPFRIIISSPYMDSFTILLCPSTLVILCLAA